MPSLKNKKVLITGGTGMIGRYLIDELLPLTDKITVVSLDEAKDLEDKVTLVKADLRYLHHCIPLCKGQDVVFNLAAIRGSPAMALKKAVDFFEPSMMIGFNMQHAAFKADVEWYLNTSSVGVYKPAPLLKEDDVWSTMPSELDKFGGWAKRMGEMLVEAYSLQHQWNKASIIRPANVFGAYDAFDAQNGMVISSLIYRITAGENPLTVWGDGSAVRDFVYAKDVARAMVYVVENEITEPVNIGSGKGVTIKELVEVLAKIMNPDLEVIWDTSKPAGDPIRIMDMSRLLGYGFELGSSLEDGLREVIDWYHNNKDFTKSRYKIFELQE